MTVEFEPTADNEQHTAAEGEHGTAESPREARFGYLLAAIVLLIVLYPFHSETPTANLIFAAINSAVLIAATFAASHSPRTLVIVSMMAAPVVVLEWLDAVYHAPLFTDSHDLVTALFFGFTIYHVLREVLRPGVVTRDKIAGAIAAYMLAAVAWASLYGLVDSLVPGSFVSDGQSDIGHPLPESDLLFFSFTTLTTTGYGDITPLSRHAQSLSILEQMAGTFYVAILIARLAGLYQSGTGKPTATHWHGWRRRRSKHGDD